MGKKWINGGQGGRFLCFLRGNSYGRSRKVGGGRVWGFSGKSPSMQGSIPYRAKGDSLLGGDCARDHGGPLRLGSAERKVGEPSSCLVAG